jgi:hypothetical protein
MEESEPDDVVEILDHYKNLKLTDTEVAELRADLANRNSMDLAILYDELRKLHKKTSEDAKDQLFLDVIKSELESRGSNTLEDAMATRKAEFSAMKQELMDKRQLAKASRAGIEEQKRDEADYRRMLNEFYTEWERIKGLGFEFPWMNVSKKAVGIYQVPTARIPEEYSTPDINGNIEGEVAFEKSTKVNHPTAPSPSHTEFTKNPAKFATVKPEALDINAEPEAALPKKSHLGTVRDIDNSKNHPSLRDKRVDKEELLNAMSEATLPELNTLLSQYESLQEQDNNDEIVKEVIAIIQEAIISKVDLD